MTTPTVTLSTDSQMPNNIMAVGSSGPYKPTTVLVQAVAATDDSPAIPEHTTVKTPMNMSPANKAHFEAEKETIRLILTGTGSSTTSARMVKKEVNKLRAERLAMNANPLALVATAQANQDPYYQTSKYKGKEIAKPITPPSESASEDDSDLEQAQRDKDMQKNLALIAKYFKKIYKPTNNNLRTSSNSRNKNVDTTQRYKNENQSGQFGNQRTMNVDGARKNVSRPVVQQSRIQYTDEEIDEQELESHYSYMAKIQEVPTADPGIDSEPLEQVQNDTGYNVFANDLQHSEQPESISNTCLVETDDSNVIPDSPDMYLKAQLQDKNIAISELKKLIEKGKGKSVKTKFDKPSVVRQPNAQRIPKPSVLGKPTPFSNSLDIRYFSKTKSVPKTNVSEGLSKPVTAQTLPQTTRKATQVEEHLRIPSIANKTKSVTAFDSNHFACVTKMLNDVNARTKKPNVVPIITRKPKGHTDKSVATPHKKKVALKPTNQKPHRYFRMLYEKTSKT
nr:hypothetical protein [Tanacetum cinerariifolium]